MPVPRHLLHAAAEIAALTRDGAPADEALRVTLGPTRHGLAAHDRHTVTQIVFAWCRWWGWLRPAEPLTHQLKLALELQARFDRDPAGFAPAALAARAVPPWLKDEMDELPVAWLRQLQRPPTLWIRAKHADAAAVATTLGHCTPSRHAALPAPPAAIAYAGPDDLHRTAAYREGRFEIQDLASQLVGHACAPRPGETWWDACAGEGGKTLHLSDLMANQGLLWATDRSRRRLTQLKQRAARAAMFNYRAAPWDGEDRLPTKTKFDGILLDAPCSGVGTWQRNPHARWTTTPQDVRELAAVQRRLLTHVAPALKPGGRLIYAVCTLTRAETTTIAAAFTAAHPEFEPVPVFPSTPTSASLTLWPHELDANGMFLATWKRKA